MNRKAQAQIITTVLIILLVLAAIVIVWQVVQGTIRTGAEEVETQSACLGLNMVVVSANATSDDVVVRRDPGAADVDTVIATIYLDDEKSEVGASPGLAVLDTETINVPGLETTSKVQVSGKVGEQACPLSEKLKEVTL